jgi:hypothetical protein
MLSNSPGVFLEQTRKTTEVSGQDSHYPHRDLNRGSLEYNSAALPFDLVNMHGTSTAHYPLQYNIDILHYRLQINWASLTKNKNITLIQLYVYTRICMIIIPENTFFFLFHTPSHKY